MLSTNKIMFQIKIRTQTKKSSQLNLCQGSDDNQLYALLKQFFFVLRILQRVVPVGKKNIVSGQFAYRLIEDESTFLSNWSTSFNTIHQTIILKIEKSPFLRFVPH